MNLKLKEGDIVHATITFNGANLIVYAHYIGNNKVVCNNAKRLVFTIPFDALYQPELLKVKVDLPKVNHKVEIKTGINGQPEVMSVIK